MNSWYHHGTAYWARLRKGRRLAFLGLLLSVFAALAIIAHSVRLLHLDVQFTRTLQHAHPLWLNYLVIAITTSGSTLFLLGLGLGIAVALYRAGRTRAAWFSLLSLLGLPLNWLLKQLVDRPRPAGKDLVLVIVHATGYSFPSGHAMASSMFYGFLLFLLWTEGPSTRLRRIGAIGLVFLIVSIGVSRVYLGDHWLSDVLAGWIAGLFFLILLIQAYRLATEKPQETRGSMQTIPAPHS